MEQPVGKEAGRCNRNERKKATLPNRWTDRFRNVGKLAFRRYHSNNSNAWCRSGHLDAGGTREIRVCCILITFRNRDIRLKILTIVAFTFRLGPRSRASPGQNLSVSFVFFQIFERFQVNDAYRTSIVESLEGLLRTIIGHKAEDRSVVSFYLRLFTSSRF